MEPSRPHDDLRDDPGSDRRPPSAGDGPLFSRLLGEGEDPLSWSLPVGRFFHTRVRVHAILPVWLAMELLAPLDPGAIGPLYSAFLVIAFFVIVLARELCRAAFARAMGRQFETVVLWPLGGVSHSAPLSRISPGIQPALAESGGILFGMLAWPVLAAAVWMLGGGWTQLTLSPLNPAGTLASIGGDLDTVRARTGANPVVLIGAWSLYYANACVLLANLLLPMAPLDASRVILAWQERRLGDAAAAAFVAKFGFVTSVVVLVAGGVMGSTRLIALAVLGGAATWIELRRSRFLAQPLAPAWFAGRHAIDSYRLPVSPEAVQEDDPAADADELRLDELLAKISARGLAAL
ncbi:MAG: hypothetical protein ACOYN0_15300, partial [Phycisphaerales bacterium]